MNTAEQKAVDGLFPGAITITALFDRIDSTLKDISRDKIRPATALCRDDSIKELHRQMDKRGYLFPFSMETLSGLPVFGNIGFAAWYHHIPDGGAGLVIFGPHIGIDADGKLGCLSRHGMKEIGKSCGANHALLGKWAKGDFGPYKDDKELSNVSEALSGYRPGLPKESQLIELTEAEYKAGLEIFSESLSKLQKTEHHHYPIFLFGGVHVDTRSEIENMFQLRDILLFQKGSMRKLN